MNPIDLVRLLITLKYDLDEDGRLVSFLSSSEQGLYIVYRYPGGCFISEQLSRLPELDEFPLAVRRGEHYDALVDDVPVGWAWSEGSNA